MRAPDALPEGANEVAAARCSDHVDAAEAARPEHRPQAALGVVEDRAVVDDLVAQLPHRPLEPRPLREARDYLPRAQLVHPPREVLRVRDVVEEAEGEYDVELPLERRVEEVALDERHPLAEAVEPLACEVEHRRREVDADILRRTGLQGAFADPARTAADVEDGRLGVRADDVECEVAAAVKPWAQRPLHEAVLVVERVEGAGFLLEVATDTLTCRRRLLHGPPRR